ncbi:MAG: hypothetical protein ING90_19040 [Rhodocyclaceae bacterium]|nr:hypothetical protein [Rhodocyclaceae bacterium]MCA3118249.1 hypothetical protein [Rhodocyclaceae bacterium]MCA3124746.1 hypothetical protein [Rhodocyclaceae bacterium]MCA3129211.1 hypothetical protein [Rhodocyclaceae bacterium]MCA3140383.1 hypothetical protein [Rhodocyclaceae bacterium]
MRRALLILLVILTPFQPVWSGMLAMSEQAPAAAVIQHDAHEHARPVSHGHAASPDSGMDGQGSQDTFHCHGHYVSMPLALPVLPMPGSSTAADTTAEANVSSRAPEVPDRPQWPDLA